MGAAQARPIYEKDCEPIRAAAKLQPIYEKGCEAIREGAKLQPISGLGGIPSTINVCPVKPGTTEFATRDMGTAQARPIYEKNCEPPIEAAARLRPIFGHGGTLSAINVYPVKPGTSTEFDVKTIHISCKSDAYRGRNHSYGGFILYGYDGKTDWFTANGTHCKSGYVVIKDTDCFPKPQDQFPSEPGIVHGAIYRSVFGESYVKNVVIGEGFSVMNGEFKTVSASFNIGDLYHDNNRSMSVTMERCLRKVVESWKASGSGFTACKNYEVKGLLCY